MYIQRHVSRVADVKEDALEALYERRLKKKAVEKQKEESELQVHPVDALPVKTLDGKLYYRTCNFLFSFWVFTACVFVVLYLINGAILPCSGKENRTF